jgi:hypothetical protein
MSPTNFGHPALLKPAGGPGMVVVRCLGADPLLL